MFRRTVFLIATASVLSGTPGIADELKDYRYPTAQNLAAFEESNETTYRLKVTIRVDAPRGAVRNVIATGPVPIDWPEQKVRLVDEQKTPGSSVRVTKIPGQGAIMTFRVPAIRARSAAAVERIYEITRSRVRFEGESKDLRPPKTVTRSLREFLKPDPGVEVKHARVTKLARSLAKPDLDGWNTCRTFYGWIRGNVKYTPGAFRGARETAEKQKGDCEDMTALFVALCRSSNIPARTVWIDNHAYPEFYLEDAQGQGHWIPAQVAGPAWFGEMSETRPILQKGDGFYDAIARRKVHYLPQSARAFGGSVQLSCTRTILPADPGN